jgi:N-acetylneuraminic acid mutarotase
MNDPRLAHTATLLPDGTVLVAGSYGEDSDGGVSDTAEIYDPATGRWTPTASMHADRSYFTATLLLDGTVLVVGGWGSSAKTSELYDPASRTWTMSASAMSVFRSDHAATLLADGRVLVVGDYKEIATYAEIYDPETGMWTATGNMNVLRNYSTVTLLSNGVVLVSGGGESGSNPDVSRSAELYNPQPGA